MPRGNRQGPPKNSKGPRTGHGGGKGYWARRTSSGAGKKTGGKKGKC